MLKISHGNCPDLSRAISAQFTLEMRDAARNRKKITKTQYFGVQSHSRSSMLTFLKSSSPVRVTINSMFVSICNHFHVKRANNGRITSFKGRCPSFSPRSWGPPSPSSIKFCRKILDSRLAYDETQISLSHLVSERYRVVTREQTDRQMDGRTDRQNYHR